MEEHPFSPIPQQQPAPQQQSPAPPPYTQVSSYAVPSPTPEQPQPAAQVPPPPVYPPNFGQPQPSAPYPPQQPIYPQMQPMQPMPAPKQKKRRTKQKPSPEQARLTKLAWIAIWLAFLLLVYCIASDLFRYFEMDGQTPTLQQSQSSTLNIQYQERPVSDAITQPDENGAYTVAGVAEAVAPSIVEITAASGSMPTSSGSGIILSEDGYIVTNAHVLQNSDTFWVTLNDSDEAISADCIGMDTKTDLAVLKINRTGLPAATIGDSDSLLVGEEVVAIGNPAGLNGTVTNGIVSALHRKIKSASTGFEMDCIQTNAAISPGNSGGALVNLYGQIVGITSSKYTNAYSGSAYEGLGFAISINAAMPILEELTSQGYVSGRVRMGITFRSLDITEVQEEFHETYQLSDRTQVSGLWISEIAEDCDISNTELQVGDVIERVNGTETADYDQLNAVLSDCKAGDSLTADCCRYDKNGKKSSFTITFQLMEGQIVGITSSKYTNAYSGSAYEGLGFAISINAAMPILEELTSQGYVSGRVRMGITFRSLDITEVQEEFHETYQLSDRTQVSGLWISEIAEDCDISNTELQVGDVIERVNGTETADYDQLNAVLSDCKAGDSLTADCCRYDKNGKKSSFTITFQLMEDRSGNF